MRHRWFMASCIVMILMGLAHFLKANVAPQPEDPSADRAAMTQLMKTYKLPELGRTEHQVGMGFQNFFEVASIAMGVAGLVVGSNLGRRRLAMVYAPSLAVLLVNSILLWFIIPTSFLAIALVLCVISLIPQRAPGVPA